MCFGSVHSMDCIWLAPKPLGCFTLCIYGRPYVEYLFCPLLQHMKNYQKLLRNVSSWLKPDGLLFIHIFVHKSIPYHFEVCGFMLALKMQFWLRVQCPVIEPTYYGTYYVLHLLSCQSGHQVVHRSQ